MTLGEFLSCNNSCYDEIYLNVDGECFSTYNLFGLDLFRKLDACRDCIISNFEFEVYDDTHLRLTIDCYRAE